MKDLRKCVNLSIENQEERYVPTNNRESKWAKSSSKSTTFTPAEDLKVMGHEWEEEGMLGERDGREGGYVREKE